MEHFTSIMERDYGFKSGKNAPMVGSPGGSSGGGGYSGVRKSVPGSRMSGNNAVYGQDDPFNLRKSEGSKPDRGYGSRDDLFSPAPYDDVFGGPPKGAGTGARYDDTYGSPARGGPADDLLGGYSRPVSKVKSTSSSFQDSPRRSDRNHAAPSEPVYDEDELVPGFGFMPKSRVFPESKATEEIDNPFGYSSADTLPSRPAAGSSATFDDDGLLSGFDSGKSRTVAGDAKSSRQSDPLMPIFDDPVPSATNQAYSSFGEEGLLPGFGRDGNKSRSFRDADASSPVRDSFRPANDDPGLSNIPGGSPPFDDLLKVFIEPQVPPSTSSSRGPGNGVKPDRLDSFDSFPSSPGNSGLFKDTARKPTENANRSEGKNTTESPEEAPSVPEDFTVEDIGQVSPDSDPFFPSQSESLKSGTGLGTSEKLEKESPSWEAPVSNEPQGDSASGSRAQSTSDDVKVAKEWLTVDDFKLMTRPSRLPPPARRPPPLPGTGFRSGSRNKSDAPNANSVPLFSEDDLSGNSSAQYVAPPSYEQAVPGWKDFNFQSSRDEEREREARAAKERRRQEREEARLARERDAREKEIRQAKDHEIRQAKEQERLRREKERERDKVRLATLEARERAAQESKERADRIAVERANGEARERAASQARERARVEKAAVERATSEARERAAAEAREAREAREREGREREARERAAAENRERERDRVATDNRERDRTATESRERDGREKAAAEARERAQMKAAVERASGEVRERASRVAAEKAAVERAQTEARERAARAAAEKAAVERAAAEARERASRAAAEKNAKERAQQQRKSETDLESFFANSGSSSTPNNDSKQRPASMNNTSSTNVFGEPRRTMSGTATTTASVDDWTSMFTDESQGRKGEASKPTKAQADRYEHTRQRAAKAIAEIKQRDIETQREQAEKQRAGEVLDSEIRRWAAGKEGNLRALLSTLQYVLWPECGWTPVSLTDLISPASVKKTYRKAALYVHPDKVQQKGATVQQKYIAEKVFDLLKEAFNKFNSEEFF